MQKYLILYATREGQTEKISRRIAEHLLSKGKQVLLHNSKISFKENLEAFDFILCGGSMHAGGVESELVKFVNANKEKIEAKPNAFFLVSLSAATKDPKLKEQWLADAKTKLQEQIKVRFSNIEMIAGALSYSKYSWPIKWIMQRIAKKAGENTDTTHDYEYTDWRQVESFAKNLNSPQLTGTK